MKSLKKIVIGILLISGLNAENDISFGVGLGGLYNGIGANIAALQPNSMTYLSLGCLNGSYSSYDGIDGSCGLGIGYVNTSLLADWFSEDNRHGLGVNVSLNRDSITKDNDLAVGVGYTYFHNEISNEGWNIGLAPGLIFAEDTDFIFFINLGYQF